MRVFFAGIILQHLQTLLKSFFFALFLFVPSKFFLNFPGHFGFLAVPVFILCEFLVDYLQGILDMNWYFDEYFRSNVWGC